MDHQKNKRVPKNIRFIDCTKDFDCVAHNKLENSERDGNIRPHYLPPEKSVCWSRSNRTRDRKTDWFKIGKEVRKAVYCHPTYLTYMQSTSCEIPGQKKLIFKSKLPGEISIASDMQMTPPLWQKVKN